MRQIFCFRVLAGIALLLAASIAVAQVQIYNSNNGLNQLESSGSVSASYSTPFSLSSYPITVTPNVSGNLASGSFFDGMSYSGTATPPCFCIGDAIAYLPSIQFGDTLTVTGSSPSQVIPYSVTMVVTPQFGTGALNYINEYFSVGGNVSNSFVKEGCFATSASGCGALQTDPSNVPYTFTTSGTLVSGGQLTFSSLTDGGSQFTVGPYATYESSSLNLDPTVQIFLPAGVSVSSGSGEFPVSFVSAVPESSNYVMLIVGFVFLLFAYRRRMAGRNSTPAFVVAGLKI